jgi:polyisoprenyl-phosphate glycosyltransferase
MQSLEVGKARSGRFKAAIDMNQWRNRSGVGEGLAKLVSIIIPCYNEEVVVEKTLSRLRDVCGLVKGVAFEWIFVDDGSSDSTRSLLIENSADEPRIKVIGFPRNFGHQIAVTAGIDAAGGDALVILDADLQDPPEVISQMIAKWREGYDVVYGIRTARPGESALKLFIAKAFYRVMNRVSEVPIPLDVGDFRLISRTVIETLRAMPERDRFLRGMIGWSGFKQTGIPYSRSERVAGASKFGLSKLIHLALDGMLSFSRGPLRLPIASGLMCILVAMVGVLYALVARALSGMWVGGGWIAVCIAVLFVGGMQLLCTGIVGEFIWRIYQETKRRPLYTIQEHVGFDENDVDVAGEETSPMANNPGISLPG